MKSKKNIILQKKVTRVFNINQLKTHIVNTHADNKSNDFKNRFHKDVTLWEKLQFYVI